MMLAPIVVVLLLLVLVPFTRWRLHLIALKAVGRVPDLTWSEMLPLLSPGSGVWLEPLLGGETAYQSIVSGDASPADVEIGHELFGQRCASCHGRDARGGSGPDLTSGRFRHGVSDWALYQVIRKGVADTPMAASPDLDPSSVWKLVGFLRAVSIDNHPPRAAEIAQASRVAVPAVSREDLVRASVQSTAWLTYAGTFTGQRHSLLASIDRDTVRTLGLDWMRELPHVGDPLEITPLVVGRTLFVSLATGETWSIDAPTGRELWHYEAPASPADLKPADGIVTRGLAMIGTTLVVPTIDARLLGINAQSGTVEWSVTVADYKSGYSLVGAPLAIGDRVVIGVAGGEYGLRGFLDAYSVSTGRRVWRLFTVPGPGERGHDTWGDSDAWTRGGGLPWATGTYDPETDLLFWGTGSPSPALDGDSRPGDNLYTSALLAVVASTGRLQWAYQFNPHDEREWDATQVPVLADINDEGSTRKNVYWASRNGLFYALDRATGRFLRATPFAKQTWNTGFDAAGRPAEVSHSRPSLPGTLSYPGHFGATHWWPPAYDPSSRTFFVLAVDGYGNIFFKNRYTTWPNGAYVGGRATAVPGIELSTQVKAIDVSTGTVRWTYSFPGRPVWRAAGLLSTAGGLVFAGEKDRFVALDAATGAELWHFNAIGEPLAAPPITYEIEGRQYLAVVAGHTLLTFSRH